MIIEYRAIAFTYICHSNSWTGTDGSQYMINAMLIRRSSWRPRRRTRSRGRGSWGSCSPSSRTSRTEWRRRKLISLRKKTNFCQKKVNIKNIPKFWRLNDWFADTYIQQLEHEQQELRRKADQQQQGAAAAAATWVVLYVKSLGFMPNFIYIMYR